MRRETLMRTSMTSVVIACCVGIATAQQASPREWIDPDTGHRVIRLSDEPGSASLYFHQNPYTPDGKKLLITVPNGLATIDLQTRAIDRIVEGRVNVIIAGRKTGSIYYVNAGTRHACRCSCSP